MLAALLTPIFFSLSVLFAARSSKVLGPAAANLGRVTLAQVLLIIWAFTFGTGVTGPALPWLFVSGVIGFGLGDLALFASIVRVGPRLAILLTQCLAAPIAALVEWKWLGNGMGITQVACAGAILIGVGVALAPEGDEEKTGPDFWNGIFYGCLSAAGQGIGAVLSRRGYLAAEHAHVPIDGVSAACQRMFGGILVTLAGFLVWQRSQTRADFRDLFTVKNRTGWLFSAAHALSGPTIGVGCYQIALKSADTGIVLPIAATAPIVTIIISRVFQGVRVRPRSLVGGIIAVGGVIALTLVQRHP